VALYRRELTPEQSLLEFMSRRCASFRSEAEARRLETKPRARLRVYRFVTRVALLFSLSIFAFSQDLTFSIPPMKTSIDAGNQPVAIVVSGTVTADPQAVRLMLSADLSDFQDHIADLLRAQLNRSDRCGELLSLELAAIQPATPRVALTAWIHYERWACVKALGKQINKKIVDGNAVIPVQLTPVVNENRQVTLTGEVGEIQADGSLGEVLRSGSFGETLQEKIRMSILAALDKGVNLRAALPDSMAGLAKIEYAAFGASNAGHLTFELAGDIAVSFDQIRKIIGPK
jgi:hypothetical protein